MIKNLDKSGIAAASPIQEGLEMWEGGGLMACCANAWMQGLDWLQQVALVL